MQWRVTLMMYADQCSAALLAAYMYIIIYI